MVEKLSSRTDALVDALRGENVRAMLWSAAAKGVIRRSVVVGEKRLVIAFTDSGILEALAQRYEFESCDSPNRSIDVLIDWSPDRHAKLIVADRSGYIDSFDASQPDTIHFASSKEGVLQFAGSWGGVEATALHGKTVVSATGLAYLAADQALTFAFLRVLHDYICLHMAVVVSDNHSIMLLGPSGSGKSTLSQLLTKGGTYVFADDLVAYSSKLNRIVRLPRWSAGYRRPRVEQPHASVLEQQRAWHLIYIGPKSHRENELLPLDPIAALQRTASSSLIVPPHSSEPCFDSIRTLIVNSHCWQLTPLQGAPAASATLVAKILESLT
ncbi:hypothetical protein [Burkholderia sp. Bp9099]|uniref:hypothetical protein n=1 Tax=Burkholderia sp. Bp9099 TaxID=2184568 RepID=UPI000F5F8867|nr:hypothetical protein [Burkholderia sp. Bp9099]